MNPEKILVPVDGSRYADNAADYAANLAKSTGAKIVLLYCRKTVPTFLGEPNSDEYLESLMRSAEKIMKPYRDKMAEAGVAFEDLIIGGSVPDVIANAATGEKCDLIVMGSKGKSKLEGLLLGSATHRVLHIAPCPVLVVR